MAVTDCQPPNAGTSASVFHKSVSAIADCGLEGGYLSSLYITVYFSGSGFIIGPVIIVENALRLEG